MTKDGMFGPLTLIGEVAMDEYRLYMREMIGDEEELVVPPQASVLQGTHNIWVEVWHRVTPEELRAWKDFKRHKENRFPVATGGTISLKETLASLTGIQKC